MKESATTLKTSMMSMLDTMINYFSNSRSSRPNNPEPSYISNYDDYPGPFENNEEADIFYRPSPHELSNPYSFFYKRQDSATNKMDVYKNVQLKDVLKGSVPDYYKVCYS